MRGTTNETRPAADQLKKPQIKPVDALSAALIEEDANEDDADVSKGTRKALLLFI